jgi:hypothetical protein
LLGVIIGGWISRATSISLLEKQIERDNQLRRDDWFMNIYAGRTAAIATAVKAAERLYRLQSWSESELNDARQDLFEKMTQADIGLIEPLDAGLAKLLVDFEQSVMTIREVKNLRSTEAINAIQKIHDTGKEVQTWIDQRKKGNL